MNTLQRTALDWYNRDVIVLPIKSCSKAAAIRWKRFQTKRPSWSLVRTWFENENRNLAVLCGAVSKNLVVLDFDSIPVYYHWKQKHRDLAKSYTVRTPRPGRHVYLRCDEPPEHTFALEGCDVKATGYVLAPPSVHPSGGLYRVASDAGIVHVPDLRGGLRGLGRLEGPRMEEGASGAPSTHPRSTPDAHTLNTWTLQPPRTHLYLGVVRDIKARLPILDLAQSYTTMRCSDGKGKWWMGYCPDSGHIDTHPSFRVDAVCQQATCLTPTCRLHEPRGMDVFEFYGRLHGLSARDTIAALALRLGLVKVE